MLNAMVWNIWLCGFEVYKSYKENSQWLDQGVVGMNV